MDVTCLEKEDANKENDMRPCMPLMAMVISKFKLSSIKRKDCKIGGGFQKASKLFPYIYTLPLSVTFKLMTYLK